ncbi:hypothetical protein J6590_048092 [Homalodisca vitripennis]|nr:hypothetical protein J6590_048092 [Homalodisca vitripennis]
MTSHNTTDCADSHHNSCRHCLRLNLEITYQDVVDANIPLAGHNATDCTVDRAPLPSLLSLLPKASIVTLRINLEITYQDVVDANIPLAGHNATDCTVDRTPLSSLLSLLPKPPLFR